MDVKRVTSGLLGFPLVLFIFIIGNKYVIDVALALIALFFIGISIVFLTYIIRVIFWI